MTTFAALLLAPGTLAAQAPDEGAARRIAGVVVRVDSVRAVADTAAPAVTPLRGVWATLHRVSRESAGPVDSVRTNANGRYDIPFRVSAADSNAVYFVSAEYGGVTYFTTPAPMSALPEIADTIVVFDTTSGPLALAVRGRHLVIGAPDSAGRFLVAEVFELENTTSRTLVAPHEGQYTWSVRLPRGAQEVRAGQGDVSPEASGVRDGQFEVYAPFAPGIKQVSFSYTLGRDDFPLAIPLTDSVEVLEVLAEPPRAVVSGARLGQVETATFDGRTLRRWLAQDVPAGNVVTVEMPPIALDQRQLYVAGILLAVGVVMLLSLARSFQRRAPQVAVPGSEIFEPPEKLAQRIVELDRRFQRRRAPGEAERAAYEAERAALKDRLTEALARRDGDR